MPARTLMIGTAAVVALALLLFLAPLIGMIVVGVIAVGVPALLITGNRGAAPHEHPGPGASGPGDRGYRGAVSVGEEGATSARGDGRRTY